MTEERKFDTGRSRDRRKVIAVRGPRGEKGEHGDKGDTGDHGQHGNAGNAGNVGNAGTTGSRGRKGEPGAQGEKGEDARYLDRKQILALFAFVVVSFLLLAYRSEVNARRISNNTAKITATQQKTCESGLEILVKFNKQQDALIVIERADTSVDPKISAARIAAYRAGKIDPLPICDPPRS